MSHADIGCFIISLCSFSQVEAQRGHILDSCAIWSPQPPGSGIHTIFFLPFLRIATPFLARGRSGCRNLIFLTTTLLQGVLGGTHLPQLSHRYMLVAPFFMKLPDRS